MPIIFTGNGLQGKQLYQGVKPSDIEGVLSAIINTQTPKGDLLKEVLEMSQSNK
jgi:hypothetical protein